MVKKFGSDSDRDQRNPQSNLYQDQEDDDLYAELKELRESLAREFPEEEITEISVIPISTDDEPDQFSGNPNREIRNDTNSNQGESKDNSRHRHTGGLLADKLKILKAEIEGINRSIEGREKIEKKFNELIDSEIKELKRQLFDIPSWMKGDKKHLEWIKLELLRQIYALMREKRMNRVNLWKDKATERRDRRNLIFEYEALKSLNGMEEKV